MVGPPAFVHLCPIFWMDDKSNVWENTFKDFNSQYIKIKTYLQVFSPLGLSFQKCIQYSSARFPVGCVVSTDNIICSPNSLKELQISIFAIAMIRDVCQIHIHWWARRNGRAGFRAAGSYGEYMNVIKSKRM